MGWRSRLTYEQVLALGVRPTVAVLATYGDVTRAAPLFAADPALANDPDALKRAAEDGQDAFVRLMLQHQPDLAHRVAVVAKSPETTELLFRQGMDANHRDWIGTPALHRFAGRGDLDHAAIFIDHGADLHARDEEFSSTPLAYAACEDRLAMVKFLLRRGARPTLPGDPPWATPIAWATRRGHTKIAGVLQTFERSGTVQDEPLSHYEALAQDLEAACAAPFGNEDAIARVTDHFRVKRQLLWDQPPLDVQLRRLRRQVHERIGRLSGDRAEQEPLSLSDAQLLIARSEGFGSWQQFAEYVAGAESR